ncbi:MAG TPA: DUF481 domain-containing protein [Planctomycetota bacterium]|jgi:putative salt-induced outer membrane protein YdiY|nr:DUF481 domain-containing protein [Planctomycetota bacterium]
MRPLRLALPLAALFALAPSSRSDEVLLANGDRLTGKILALGDGKLTFESAMFGKVTIPLASVKTFATEGPVEIHFRDATVVRQPIATAEAGRISVGPGGVVQPQTFSLADIAAINPPKREGRWTGSATAGFTVTRGNSETQGGNVVVDAVRRSEQDRLSFRGEYAAARQVVEEPNPTPPPATVENHTTTQRLITGTLKYDAFFSERSYFLASVKADKDAIADLDLRFVASAGYGYQWAETDATKFSTELGLGWLHEDFREPDPPTPPTPSTDQIAARAGYRLEKVLSPSVKLLHPTEAVHGFDDAHDFLVQTEGALRASLTKAMFSEVRVVLNWDSTPANGKERSDVRYVLGFGLAF